MSIVNVFGHKIRIVHFDEVTVRNAVLCCAVDTCGRLTEIETNTYKDCLGLYSCSSPVHPSPSQDQ